MVLITVKKIPKRKQLQKVLNKKFVLGPAIGSRSYNIQHINEQNQNILAERQPNQFSELHIFWTKNHYITLKGSEWRPTMNKRNTGRPIKDDR